MNTVVMPENFKSYDSMKQMKEELKKKKPTETGQSQQQGPTSQLTANTSEQITAISGQVATIVNLLKVFSLMCTSLI
jgi:hypothetical protein